MKLIGLKN